MVLPEIGVDGDDTNDILDRDVPIAYWFDPMENGFCEDEANEGKFCTNNAVPLELQLGTQLDIPMDINRTPTTSLLGPGGWRTNLVLQESGIGKFQETMTIMLQTGMIDLGGHGRE